MRVFHMPLETIPEKHTVDEQYIEGGFGDQEFPDTMRSVKIIELKAELEAKRALLEALIREKQQVNHERDRKVMRNGSVDKREASDTGDKDDNFIGCARESEIPFARHSVITYTSESAHDESEGGKTNTNKGFFKSLAQFIRTKREEARPSISSRANGGSFDSSAKSLCMESTPASEGRMQQAVEQFGANLEACRAFHNKGIQDARKHLLRVCSSQDAHEGNALMERFMRLQRLSSLIDFPDTIDRLMSRSSPA